MLLSRCCVHLSLTCVISAVETRLTTLNFMSKESDLFAESVTVLFLFRAWTRLLGAIKACYIFSYTSSSMSSCAPFALCGQRLGFLSGNLTVGCPPPQEWCTRSRCVRIS